MDPFKHFLSTEGCSSSESGWTRYLASPMQDDSECSENNYSNNHNIKDDVDDGEGNSDDSMVSDASSAPSHHQYKHKDGPGSHSNTHVKPDKSDYTSKHYSSRKEVKKEVKKSGENSGKSKKRLDGQAKNRK
ncbi:uncharacterized protein LOC111313577 [Durio zibethinus]|uniref:Uncharacterized protein LOC111313577 n=1 Tax=Durio zibethinus TaxID=66656 RepID=A0A6P6AZ01_DURZI|nr:uncharacterized protein LOC111313577 [Durio zibethinus]